MRGRELAEPHATFIPFTAQTRMSGVDPSDGPHASAKAPPIPCSSLRRGAGRQLSAEVGEGRRNRLARRAARRWWSPKGSEVLGVVQLKDVVKGGIKERFAQLRKMGIRTVMITGDNPLTAAAIAAEAGVDDFMAQATPEDKLEAHPRGAGRRATSSP